MQRDFLKIVGDGKTSVQNLIEIHPRAKFYQEDLEERYQEDLNKILKKDEIFSLGEIGNHCRGTKFCNANHLISEKMSQSFQRISENFAGFYYGRYDVKAKSIEDLENGNVKIIEVNGYSSEPGHLYDPKTSITEAYESYFWHISQMSKISRNNHKNGFKYAKIKEAQKIITKHW